MSEVLIFDFFGTDCQTGPHTEKIFGICDVPDGGRAYVDTVTPVSWIAKVFNKNSLNVRFTAIDGCVLPNDKGPKRCDAMLTTVTSIYLVELKDQRSTGWVNAAKEQIASSIQLLRESNSLNGYQLFKAHICNKKRPIFHGSRREMCEKFHEQHGFHLRVAADIHIAE